ncbi:unnamed protein product [Chilo suppressalis]|uniref:LIM zinc-binding domain-containing protein n=1 Tax=Chilo suppressalis TaxID=168631 RepID=A0ABN8B9V7_CHISP|nr:unnamed protein product [Chilo suppressalis]
MPCVVCQHCHKLFKKEDEITVQEGYSYHKKCHKCYVCSETNLKNAEVFMGVIFCYRCAQRIFRGCCSARRAKTGTRAKAAAMARVKRRNRSRHHQYKKDENSKHHPINGVLELTQLEASTESGSSHRATTIEKMSNSLKLIAKPAQGVDCRIMEDTSKFMEKKSTEIGVTTEVTQELLRQMNCPVVDNIKYESKIPVDNKSPKDKGDNRYNKTIICSDLRMAELGVSTEIAHMALRKKSEMPVIIKSDHRLKERGSFSLSGSRRTEDSDATGSNNVDWLQSIYSLKVSDNPSWLDRTVGSILKIPYRFFKNKILDRSSRIGEESRKSTSEMVKNVKLLFYNEITRHQHRGVKRLYSTINRRSTPYKLGWLNLVSKVSAVINPAGTIRQQIKEPKRCIHFRSSHSYRCMRAQVMKQAGPTKSELAIIRSKLKNILFAPSYLANYYYTKPMPAVMSQACGTHSHQLNMQSLTKNIIAV